MKKRIALLLCGMSAASAVWATDTVNIDVDVTVDAAACTPALSNGGVADFGTRYAGSLSTSAFTQLGTRDLTLSVTCESSTGVAITARDTRASSVVVGKDKSGQEGVKFQINNGAYVRDTTRLFGLGLTSEQKPIGSYGVQINAAGVTAADESAAVQVEIAGAATKNGPWTRTTLLPLPTQQDFFYTFVQKGTDIPQPISSAVVPLQVSAAVANGLGSGQEIKLDGEAVITLVYL
ncbi:DUF1120 domain-containing protein [Enterobacter hormaechei subsp. hoffmannii]|uniref:DUF1120 domain-containing protein n=1 Tax=Enterobacter hormaechei TaxID=158836 RepID=UPI001E2914B8|nr:DUF1120 domain-containing protein [Enterobacter hormaechei]MCU3022057.1 DUF1120 domain-containing protein [Enterobacter hormaechei subsp. hoffmannii]MCU4007619.1 DUF1120 domain-containing protein [Enterobacter hormaechei subsp. hoffmannii]